MNNHTDTLVSEEDIQKMLGGMWNGTNGLSTTSKLGQASRLLMKINLKKDGFLSGLQNMNKIEPEKDIEDITDVVLHIDKLCKILERAKSMIDDIEFKADPILECSLDKKKGTFDEIFSSWAKKSKIKIKALP